MKYGRIKHKAVSTIVAAVLAPAFALGATYFGPEGAAQAAGAKANCRVHAVLASKEGDGKIPKQLEFLRETLEDDQFGVYKSFHLVDKKMLKLDGPAPASAKFASGHQVGLALLDNDEKLKLHLELTGRDGTTNLVKTDYSIEDNGLFMIAAGAFKQGEVAGKLFFAIQCASKKK
jgi:hypothetical protein